MSRSLFAKSKKQKPVSVACVCTVDSHSVTAAAVKVWSGQGAIHAPVVIFSAQKKVQGDKLSDVIHPLREILEMVRSHGGNPDLISCVIGEPWIATIPRTIKIEKAESFKLTQKTVDDALLRDMRASEADIRRDVADPDAIAIVDVSDPIWSVNGYRTDNVIGSVIPSLELDRSVSIMPGDVLDEIGLAISEVFHREDIIFHSAHHAFANYIANEKALSLRVGGVSSEWSVIDRGVISAVQPIPAGLVEIEEVLKHEFSIPKTLIESTMSFATDEGLALHEKDVYYRRIERAASGWLHAVRSSLEEIRKKADLLPRTLVLSSDAPWILALAPVIARELDMAVAVLSSDYIGNDVVFSHDARAKTNALGIAIEYSIKRMNS
ncbi:MAG: hypothetical protein JWM20_131 [Patescibacteria group bacterium]|nr:hypothetical protein [Patescibacteria group bacterium]